METPEEAPKLLYIVVVEDDATAGTPPFRYSRSVLQSTLQLMGCKPRHAFKISLKVFKMAKRGILAEGLVLASFDDPQNDSKEHHPREIDDGVDSCLNKANVDHLALSEDKNNSKLFELYKRRTTVVIRRSFFLNVCCEALSEYKYVGPNQRADLVLACRIRERKQSVTVLLCGTSGCGKSTLSSILGSRLGITTVVSTDSIRHMMRSFVDEKENPLLWASTYHAGEYLDRLAVVEAKVKRKSKKSAGSSVASLVKNVLFTNSTTKEGDTIPSDKISQKQMAVEGFKAQSEMVIDSLDRLITSWEEKKESVVVEGVHLSLNFVMGLMKKHPSIIPFMIYIANEEKHMERFAVRAKYMTLDPAKNKYIKYIRNIRTIQEYLCNRADKHLVPKINNTNVDKSVAIIHATVFSCLRRRVMGDRLYDPITNTVAVIDEDFRSQRAANSLTSEGMFHLIQRKGSSRQLMALLNNDGSVAKAWPVGLVDDNGKLISGYPNGIGIGTPMYGPLQIGKAEPVNLQFGHFGISAWPSYVGGTSRASSVDDSRSETENGSRNVSCCSSPRGPHKELMEEVSVNGSDEEADELPEEADSDEDLSDGEKHLQEELEGSVDEESNKSDEYDDLAMLDSPDNGNISEDDEDFFYRTKVNDVLTASQSNSNEHDRNKYQQNLDLFLKTIKEPLSGSLMCGFASPLEPSGCLRIKRRSLSIPTLRELVSPVHVVPSRSILS